MTNVVVLDNGAYVDASNGLDAEFDNIQAAINAQGHAVSRLTGLSASEMSSELSGNSVLVIPEQERGKLIGGLSEGAREALRGFTSMGGTVIVSADA